MSATAVTLAQVTASYGDTVAVDRLSLDVSPGSFVALLGPSGCGKSTTLSVLAGLTRPDTGDVLFDGVSVLGLPAERRPVGLVFQKPLLFPHLSVADNVGFGLRMRGVRSRERSRRVAGMLERVQLDGLGDRRVGELSGGQEQRVALARALVLEPRVLLLDEPFSQLDTGLRARMRALLRRLHDEGDLTTVFVTHDQAEAVEVADTIALLLDGRLAGHDRPQAFYTRPASLAAARFFGVTNELRGHVRRGRFTAASARLEVVTDAADGPAVLTVRPEAVGLCPADGSGSAPLVGEVAAARFAGDHLVVDVLLGGEALRAHVPLGHPVSVGGPVAVRLDAGSCTVFPSDPSDPAHPAHPTHAADPR